MKFNAIYNIFSGKLDNLFDKHKLLQNINGSTLPHKEYLLKMVK